MGFFDIYQTENVSRVKGPSIDLLHKQECKACPLNRELGLKHPHMKPTGSDAPLIYMLGEAPGIEEDRRGRQFVGSAGQVLRFRIPMQFENKLRWNNVVRTRPPRDREPSTVEIECCRPSVIKDIEQSKPKAIFGFGNIPLHWMIGQNGISQWRGRVMPVKIGNHSCWFFPMLHPSYVLRDRKFEPRSRNEYGSDQEFVFALDLKKAFRMIDELPEPIVHTRDDAFSNLEIILGDKGDKDVHRIKELLESLYDEKWVGIDFETNCYRPYEEGSKILTVGLSSKNLAFAFPIRHKQSKWTEDQLNKIELYFKRFLRKAKCRKISHNLSFELEWVGNKYGLKYLRNSLWEDSMGQAYILDHRKGVLSLEDLVLQYFGLNIKQLSNLDRSKLDSYPLFDVLRYNAVDAKYHRLLFIKQNRRLKKEKSLETYKNHLRRIPTVVLTQLSGIPVHQPTVKKFDRIYSKKVTKLENKIQRLKVVKKFRSLRGEKFNPGSNPHVKFILNKILNKDVENVGEIVLASINSRFTKLILQLREVSKLQSTYVKPLLEGSPIVYPDGKLHPILATMKTSTWRTSSEKPNEQNFPKRENRQIRSMIMPGGDYRVVSFDYAQIQARNIAMESKDKALVKAFWDRYDIHADWVERIAARYPKWIDGGVKQLKDKKIFKYYRDLAKNQMVFPSFFGAQYRKIAGELGIPEEVAIKLHEEFWDMFPDIKGWQDKTIENYEKKGYVTGLSGFRRRAPIAKNEIINAPIQSDESLIVLDAMSRLSELDFTKYQASMEIHDDLTFIWHKDEIDKRAEVVVKEMLNVPFEWANIVPIGVEMSVGKDWAHQEPVGEYFSDKWNGMIRQSKEAA